MRGPGGRSEELLAAVKLSVFCLVLATCSAPPAPPVQYASAHSQPMASERAATAPRAAAERCGLVRRAARTWVGFAEGMSLDDVVPAGRAAAEVVKLLDARMCGMVQHGERLPALAGREAELRAGAAAAGGAFEVTKLLWQDVELSQAQVELSGLGAAWTARVVRQGDVYRLLDFASTP